MDSLRSKIQEIEEELSGFGKTLQDGKQESKKLEFETNQVKLMKESAMFIINMESRIVQESRSNMKEIHEAYQELSTQPTSQYLQYSVMNRLEELYQEKEKLVSKLGYLKLKRGKEEAELEEIKMKVTARENKKRAMLLKLEKNCEKSEAARKEAVAKLREVKNKQK
ncbi:uncharacterized protein LOC117168015 [Belonocnema kinseyi]|uniref:uncharacterized protein LOC117168015 n=1 Tax=Belonocnema kinseyi TaxID=2817044 RepID=UPI00143D753E|nr:uncharacterized protein LOC117168015 [Belonocnema kinseyi]